VFGSTRNYGWKEIGAVGRKELKPSHWSFTNEVVLKVKSTH